MYTADFDLTFGLKELSQDCFVSPRKPFLYPVEKWVNYLKYSHKGTALTYGRLYNTPFLSTPIQNLYFYIPVGCHHLQLRTPLSRLKGFRSREFPLFLLVVFSNYYPKLGMHGFLFKKSLDICFRATAHVRKDSWCCYFNSAQLSSSWILKGSQSGWEKTEKRVTTRRIQALV